MASWIIDRFPDIAELMSGLLPSNYLLYSTDLSKFIFTDKTNCSLPTIKVGQTFAKGSVADKVIKNKRPIEMEIDPKVYGVGLKVINIPIFDDENPQEVAGTVGIGIKWNRPYKLCEIAEYSQKEVEGILTTTQEVSILTKEINASAKILHDQMLFIQEKVNHIFQILNYINNAADKTRILGFNASIAAARAEKHGQGFGVVASEVHKLSKTSRNIAHQIGDLARIIEYNTALGLQSTEAILEVVKSNHDEIYKF